MSDEDHLQALLVLEDGTAFHGVAAVGVGAGAHECDGEVVFVTAMAGYQEVCTDPSYWGQIVVMTSPLIGNYGATPADDESDHPWLSALVVCELSAEYAHWAATESFGHYLTRHQIPCIAEVDTRALTRHLRQHGAQHAIICCYPAGEPPDTGDLRRRAADAAVRAASTSMMEVALAQVSARQSRAPSGG
ncbi:MAG: carbamoyl-phosphate synthase domain-containing protein, partial [Ktedonobacterales bacterium]